MARFCWWSPNNPPSGESTDSGLAPDEKGLQGEGFKEVEELKEYPAVPHSFFDPLKAVAHSSWLMSNYSPTRDTLAKRIAGEIVLSNVPGQTMRKWRGLLSVSQTEMANSLELSPSVISDYETGRRRSPGSGFIKRYVEVLLEIDEGRGGVYIRQLSRITLDPSDVFIDIREFMAPVQIAEVVEAVKGTVYAGEDKMKQDLFGYTIVDSLKAIMMLSGLDFYRIFGTTSERALVFSNVSRGRSPMIAVKISPFKPRIIVLHGVSGDLDPLAVQLAKHEGIPLAVSGLKTENELVEALVKLYKSTE